MDSQLRALIPTQERWILAYIGNPHIPADGEILPHMNLDWDLLLDRSRTHHILPLLSHLAKRNLHLPPIPSDILQYLKTVYNDATWHAIRLYRELGKRIEVLVAAGIPVILLKGAHLGESVYQNIALRTMTDVDIMVPERDVRRAQQVLLSEGFSVQGKTLVLDLHWNLTRSITELDIDPIVQGITENIDIDAIWERAVFTEIAGVRVRVLCPEDLLLHLCIHLSVFHLFRFGQVKALCDIHHTVLMFQEAFDWDAFLGRADEWGVSNAVHLTLIIAHELLGTPFPEPVLERMRPAAGEPGKLAWAVERIFTAEAQDSEVSPKFWHLVGRGPIQEKVRALRNLLFPPVDMLPAGSLHVSGTSKGISAHYRRLRSQFLVYGRLALKLLFREPSLVSRAAAERDNLKMKRWLSSSPE